jgi:hypothetical protein
MSLRQSPDKPGHESGDASRAPSPSLRPSALDRMMSYAVPLVGVIGAALYGVLRLAYLFFYLRLRASPDEVGYGYSQVLADELIGAIELVLLVALFLMVPVSVIILSLRLLRNTKVMLQFKLRKGNLQRVHEFDKAYWIAKARKLVLWCLVIAIPLVLIGLPILGWLEGEEAHKGYTVRNVYLTNFIALPVLAVEAVPAKVAWIAADGSDKVGIAARQCLLYLGQNGGTAVFYDVHSEESIRLPDASIIITLQDTTSVPIGCLYSLIPCFITAAPTEADLS